MSEKPADGESTKKIDDAECKHTVLALKESEERFNVLYEESPLPTFTWRQKGDDFEFIHCNKAAMEISSGEASKYIGKTANELYGDRSYILRDFQQCFAEKKVIKREVLSRHFMPQKIIEASFLFIPPEFVLVLIQDVTERKQDEQAMREASTRLELCVNASNIGLWDWNLSDDSFHFSPVWKSQIGYADDEITDKIDEWLNRVHPDDLKPTLDKELAFLEHPEGKCEIEFRLRHKDGSYRWIYTHADVLLDAAGKPERMLGCHIDITELKRVQEQLKASEEKYRSLVDNLPLGITLIGPEMMILTLNNNMKRKFPEIDVSKQPICYRSFFNPPRDTVCPDCPVIKTFRNGKVYETIQNASSGNDMAYVRLISSPIKDHEGKVTAVIQVVEDITERMVAEAYIQDLSHQILNAQENERQMISRELHDSVAQDLSSIKIALETLFDKKSVIPDEVYQKISGFSQMVQRSISTVRNLAYDLRPAELTELGLIRTLSAYCEEFARNTGINVKFFSAGIQKSMLDSFAEINIYRLIQESLSNVRKHAEAGQVTIRMVAAYPNIILRVEDDGKGFDVEARARARASEHERRIGLDSMKERVSLLRGKMTVQSYPMKGTKLVIKFPIKESENESEKTHPYH